jgi:hypothetical protein
MKLYEKIEHFVLLLKSNSSRAVSCEGTDGRVDRRGLSSCSVNASKTTLKRQN